MKMTDKDVIKALEKHIENTKNIKYGARKVEVVDAEFLKDTLDLINRQQTEIERWKNEAICYQDLWCEGMTDVQTAKSEAYKEFSKRLKSIIRDMRFLDEAEYQCEYIDDIVKEVTEGSK